MLACYIHKKFVIIQLVEIKGAINDILVPNLRDFIFLNCYIKSNHKQITSSRDEVSTEY